MSCGSDWAVAWDRCCAGRSAARFASATAAIFRSAPFLINTSGAFPMGYLSVLFAVDWHMRHGTALTALCLTGIIGGYTTFSSMQMDALRLAGTKRPRSCRVLSRAVGRVRSARRRARGRARAPAGLRRTGMVNFVILVLVGGGLGAMLREFVTLMVPNLADGFPMDILAANLVAAFLLGLVTALHRWQVLSDDVNMLLGAGIMGGMSTFSSFVYGSVVLMQPRRRAPSSRQSTSQQSGARLPRDHCRRQARQASARAGRCGSSGGRPMSLDPLLLSRISFYPLPLGLRGEREEPAKREGAGQI
jgi:CrcB protein